MMTFLLGTAFGIAIGWYFSVLIDDKLTPDSEGDWNDR